jgi:hypothetical protein
MVNWKFTCQDLKNSVLERQRIYNKLNYVTGALHASEQPNTARPLIINYQFQYSHELHYMALYDMIYKRTDSQKKVSKYISR